MFNLLGMANFPTKVNANTSPKLTGVQIVDKSPVNGTYPTLKLTSKGSSSVQYSVYMYSKSKKTWENVSGGYTKAVKGNSTYTIKLKKPLLSGDNSYSVWVKNAGTPAKNKAGYDDFKSYTVNVKSTSSQALPSIKSVNIDANEKVVGVNPNLKIVSNGSGKVQYRVYLYSANTKTWEDVTGGYTAPVDATSTASLKLSKALKAGENSFSIWVKRNGLTPSNKAGYDNFLSYKVNVGTTTSVPDKTPVVDTPDVPSTPEKLPESTVISKITSANIDSSEVTLGGTPTITLKSTSDRNVQYNVYLYSQSKNVWEDVSNGYTSSVDPEKPYSLKITKPLQPGRNTFSIWVKRHGIAPSDKGGYDSFVQETVTVNAPNEKSAKITGAYHDTDKIAVGTKPEVTVIGGAGDDSDISYKAFLYSNSQNKWLDASIYSSIGSGDSKVITLDNALETGTNKVLVWAKRTSITGDVYEDYKIIEIETVKPGPMKKLIVVDPGHGGKDPGALNHATGSQEKIIALSVSLKLGDILKSNGYEVIYTRTDDNVNWNSSDQNASLKYRYTFANTNGADLFVSIHCNSYNGANTGLGTASGTEILYSKQTPNKDKALAQSILDEYLKTTGMKSRGIKNNGNWQVVNHTKMPASLVELAFIDNQSDELKLKDPAFQQKAAQGVANGIIKYLGK